MFWLHSWHSPIYSCFNYCCQKPIIYGFLLLLFKRCAQNYTKHTLEEMFCCQVLLFYWSSIENILALYASLFRWFGNYLNRNIVCPTSWFHKVCNIEKYTGIAGKYNSVWFSMWIITLTANRLYVIGIVQCLTVFINKNWNIFVLQNFWCESFGYWIQDLVEVACSVCHTRTHKCTLQLSEHQFST